jgi:hypothetical protein
VPPHVLTAIRKHLDVATPAAIIGSLPAERAAGYARKGLFYSKTGEALPSPPLLSWLEQQVAGALGQGFLPVVGVFSNSGANRLRSHRKASMRCGSTIKSARFVPTVNVVGQPAVLFVILIVVGVEEKVPNRVSVRARMDVMRRLDPGETLRDLERDHSILRRALFRRIPQSGFSIC